MGFRVRKMVVIGLGGTGRDAVLNVKRRYLELYGTVDVPTTKFLVLDTTDDKGLTLPDGRTVKLGASEFFKMSVSNPLEVISHNSEVKSWFPEQRIPLMAVNDGAGQVRARGRLSLFANAGEIHSRISMAFNGIKALRPHEQLGEFELVGDSILINIIGSLSGGTGSGTFLDMAYLCRQFQDTNDTLVGYLLLPDVFVNRPATDNVQPNAYGALKELDFLMDGNASRSAQTYKFGGHSIRANRNPFDVVYLVNNTNRDGVVYQDVEELTELLGLGVFISSGPAGKDATDIWDNLRSQILGRGKYNGKSAVYASFGVSELVLNTSDVADQLTHTIAIKLIENTFLGQDARDTTDNVDEYIARHSLLERDADQVIDDLLPPGSYRRFPEPEDVDRKNIDEILNSRDSHLANVEVDCQNRCSSRLEELKRKQIDAFRSLVAEELTKPNGLRYVQFFAQTLASRLEQFREEMNEERDDFRLRSKATEGRYGAIREDAEQAKRRILGAGKLLLETAKNFQLLMDEEARLLFESIRRNAAGMLYTALIGEANDVRNELEQLSKRLEATHSNLNSELTRIRGRKRAMRPFTIEVNPPKDVFGAGEHIRSEDFLLWLSEGGSSVLKLAEIPSLRLEALILDYARQRQEVRQLSSLRIEDVLRQLPNEEISKYVRSLDRVAVPLWRYEQWSVGEGRKTDEIYVIGVQNSQDSFLTEDAIHSMLGSKQTPQITSTADPLRIFCYKIEAAVPAFVLKNIQMYKMRYENRDAPFSYHVHKEWEKTSPDLWPNADTANRWVWSLSNAQPFGLIARRGHYYVAISKKQGREIDNFEISLDKGRENALKSLLANRDLVVELEEEIERATRTRGSRQTAQALEVYIESLVKQPVGSENIRRLIEDEISDVRAYVESLTSLA